MLFSVRRLLLHVRYVARHSEYPPLEMNGVRVLLVEDAEFIGELIHDMFRDAGATVVAQTQSVPATLRILHTQPVDVVCLDILLGNQPSFAVADLLVIRAFPSSLSQPAIQASSPSGIATRFSSTRTTFHTCSSRPVVPSLPAPVCTSLSPQPGGEKPPAGRMPLT